MFRVVPLMDPSDLVKYIGSVYGIKKKFDPYETIEVFGTFFGQRAWGRDADAQWDQIPKSWPKL